MEEYRAEQGSERNAGDCMDMLQHLISCRIIIIIITRNSLVRAKGEVFVLLYVFLFFCLFGQRFLDNPRADSRQSSHAGVLWLVPDVSSPLLGVGDPRRAEKGANEIFVTMGVNGEFLHFGGF